LLSCASAVKSLSVLVTVSVACCFVNACDWSLDSCKSDLECPPGEACGGLLPSCQPGCRNDECPRGEVCQVLAPSFSKLLPSPSDYACWPGCAEDSDCELHFRCDTGTNRCVCKDNQGCAADQVCTDGSCQCPSDASCGPGMACVSGRCECATDEACGTGNVCFRGVCEKQCRSPSDCNDGQVCAGDISLERVDGSSVFTYACTLQQSCGCVAGRGLVPRDEHVGTRDGGSEPVFDGG